MYLEYMDPSQEAVFVDTIPMNQWAACLGFPSKSSSSPVLMPAFNHRKSLGLYRGNVII